MGDEILQKAIKTCQKHNMLNSEHQSQLNTFATTIMEVKGEQTKFTIDESLAPEKYLDPLLYTLMKDPVILPRSKTIMDRTSITQHLLNDAHDPFTRDPLTVEELIPNLELKKEIDLWIVEQQQKLGLVEKKSL